MQLFSVQHSNNRKQLKTTGKAIQLILHGIRFEFEHLDLLKHRAMTLVQVNQCQSILCVPIDKRMSPFLVNCRALFFLKIAEHDFGTNSS